MKCIALIILLITICCKYDIVVTLTPNYDNIQFKQATNIILSFIHKEDHPIIHNTFKNKKTQLVSLYIFYRPKKNASKVDIKNDVEHSCTFAQTYEYGSTAYHPHMISVDVFFYSNTLESMLVEYAVT